MFQPLSLRDQRHGEHRIVASTAMDETPASLLERLREQPNDADWRRLTALYEPWLRIWLRARNIQDADASDIAQDVIVVLFQKLPGFHYDPGVGRFRTWLRTIVQNKLLEFWKARRHHPQATGDSKIQDLAEQLADPHSGLSSEWDREHDAWVLRRAVELIRPEFTETTFEAFRRAALLDQDPADVARDLEITRNAVYCAKAKVLQRLREEVRGLCDEVG